MDQYTVTGMSCAACQARVEKAVSRVEGVTSCNVSLLTNTLGVEGSASSADIIRAVENAGYGASLRRAGGTGTDGPDAGSQAGSGGDAAALSARLAAEEEALRDHETPVLRRRLIASVGFLLVLMYFSMGHMMWGWPLPAFFEGNHVAMGLVQLLLAAIVMVINQKFFISGFKSLFHGAPNMDTLIAMGSGAAFVYSTAMLLAMTRAQADGNSEAVMGYMMEFYFESAAMILTLITVGKMLEAMSKGRTTDALKSLMKLAPKTATVIRRKPADAAGEAEETEVTVPIEQVRRGDIFVVRPGDNIPVDGIVLEGSSAVNEAALTGESIPVDKAPGDAVSSATMNQSGYLRCEATRVGEDTSLAQIIRMVSDAAATKAPIARLADTISGIFVPAVIVIAVLVTLLWLVILRQPLGFSLARGISVLVVSCPCALGLATPVAIMVGNGIGARNGILFKTAESLQEAGNVQIVTLDKTGTITRGEPQVTDILPAGVSENDLLYLAGGLEQHSEHPLAKAVTDCCAARGIQKAQVREFTAVPGNGLTADVSGWKMRGGNFRFISEGCTVPEEAVRQAEELASQGRTPLFFSREGAFLGIIAVADTIKEDSAQAVQELRDMGIRVVMLTGDNRQTAEAIGREAGVDEVVAGVLPDGKEEIIRRLSEKGRVAMVGDGINDAPALTRADIGIAIGAGTDVAIDAADVVLMNSRLTDVSAAVRLSRRTYRTILWGLFWALIYNSILIPVAAGLLVPLGITMDPMFGALAMSLSSFCVVTNALRLNGIRLHDSSSDRPLKNALPRTGAPLLEQAGDKEETETAGRPADQHRDDTDEAGAPAQKGENLMTRTMKIEGMMCGHCEMTVKKALEALDGVESAQVSHEAGTAVVTLSGDVTDDTLKAAVEAKDYEVKSIA